MDTTRRLPDGELAVMQALWDLEPPVTSGELQQQLKESHPMALTTLLTVLTRLADKEFVKIEKEGRSSISALGKAAGVPTPIIDSVITLAGALVKQDFWQTGRTLKSLNIAGLTREELDELRDLLERGTL